MSFVSLKSRRGYRRCDSLVLNPRSVQPAWVNAAPIPQASSLGHMAVEVAIRAANGDILQRMGKVTAL